MRHNNCEGCNEEGNRQSWALSVKDRCRKGLPQHIVQLPHSLAGNVSRQVAEGKGRVSNLLEALREPLKLDRRKAEWLAEQLLEAGEKGILVPANIVLDAYTRGKARFYLRKHFFQTGVVLALTCTFLHLSKQAAKRVTRSIPVVGSLVRFICDTALPTSILAMALVAGIML